LRRPWTVYVPSGFLSGMSLAANEGGGGRSTLIGAIAVASGSGPIEAPDELEEQPAATRPSIKNAVFMRRRLLIVGARRKPGVLTSRGDAPCARAPARRGRLQTRPGAARSGARAAGGGGVPGLGLPGRTGAGARRRRAAGARRGRAGDLVRPGGAR